MAHKAIRSSSDSQNPVAPSPSPRKQRKYTLTPLGHAAVQWLNQQDEKPLPLDALPHITIKKS